MDPISNMMKRAFLLILLVASMAAVRGQEAGFPDHVSGNWYKTDGSGDWIAGFHGNLLIWQGKVYENPGMELKGKLLNIKIPDSDQILYAQSGTKGKLKLGTDPRKMETVQNEPVIKKDFKIADPDQASGDFFRRDSVRISGFIKGYTKKAQENSKFSFVDLITGQEVVIPFEVEANGQFSASAMMSYPQMVRGLVGGRFRSLFPEPGTDLFIFIDGKEMLFMGESSRINRELTDLAGIQFADLYQMIAKMMVMSWPEFRQWSLDWVSTKLDSLNHYASLKPVSARAMKIKQREVSFPAYGYILSFNEAKKSLGTMYKAEPKDTAFQPGEGFYSFIRDEEVSDPHSLSTGASFLSLLEEFGGRAGRAGSYAGMQKKLAEDFGITGTLVPDLLYAHRLAGMMGNDMRPLTPQEADSVRRLIREPAIRERLMEFSREQEGKAEALRLENLTKSGYFIPEVPEAAGEVILDSIVAQYRGKVVFVDFWATWCAPCRAGMQRMKPLKEEYEGKEIAFVYITDPSSPLSTWSSMIPDIKGYHYRLGEDKVAPLYKKYEIRTIPRYMLFDKSGQLINGDLGGVAHDNGSLKELIDQNLK